ncbi:hypothetical protein AVEN_40611-1 [Araneus ventricosus]|uniref:Spidroin N-terminal domain-containing protein n=1 Tax=Araneus ventricosus TaxID=182803 RepID=A0A4Y2J9R3_ARAVE|nr:hypothetical protein AVEN_40611-1 [Araneus ventricosus]
MGWISHVFIAACFLGLSLKTSCGTDQVGIDPKEFNETEKKFAKVFIKNVMKSKEFGTKGNMDFMEVTETLLKAISLLQQTKYSDSWETEALMYAFASAIAELIVDQCDERVGIVEKTNIVTNALQKAYLKTSGHTNDELIKEVRILVMIFLSIDNMAEYELFEPLFQPLEFENNYGRPEGFNRYEVPEDRLQTIRRRYYRAHGPQPRLIPVGGAPSGQQGRYLQFPRGKYSQFQQGGYPLSQHFSEGNPQGSQFPARGTPESPMSPHVSKRNGPQSPQDNPQGPQGTKSPEGGKPESLEPQDSTPGPEGGKPLSPMSPQSTMHGKPKNPLSPKSTLRATEANPLSPMAPQGNTSGPEVGKPKNSSSPQGSTPRPDSGKPKGPLSPQGETPGSDGGGLSPLSLRAQLRA